MKGNTFFLGDSMMVGVPEHVHVEGDKRVIAEVGKPSAWALAKLRSTDTSGFVRLIILTGVNDFASSSVESIFQNIKQIWDDARNRGLKVWGATLPPFGGWSPFLPNQHALEQKRIRLNAMLRDEAGRQGVGIIPLDVDLASPSDSSVLSSAADSGDHLHPKKTVLAQAIQVHVQDNPSVKTFPWKIALTLLAAGAVGTLLLARKRPDLLPRPARKLALGALAAIPFLPP